VHQKGREMKKLADEIRNLIWTLAGTGMVLITLSGRTKTLGWTISIIALIASILFAVLSKDE
jgi:hypothetical protein